MSKSKNKKKKRHLLKNGQPKPISQTRHLIPSISVCMIVKNEERFLDNCLQSVKDIADEIIIIDTGSEDNTVNIAEKYTDRIYFHPWEESFSEARNRSFDYATGDWIFQIDADEELVKEDVPVLLKAVKNRDIDAVLVQIISHLDNGQFETRHNIIRIFRNNGSIHYEGRIHERIVGSKRPIIYPIHLIHHGYDLNDRDLSDIKHQRRVRLLKMDIEESPDNPLPYHYLSCCYLSARLFRETLEVALKSLLLANKKKDKDPIYLWTRYNAAVSYYQLKDFTNAESMAISAIAVDNRHIDSYFILTLVNFDQAKWPEAIKYGNEYISLSDKIKRKPEDFDVIVNNSLNESWKVLLLMGIAFHETGDPTKSEDSFQSAISHSLDAYKAFKTIGTYFFKKALLPLAGDYLKKAFDLNGDDPEVKEMLDKISSGVPKNNYPTIAESEKQHQEMGKREDANDLFTPDRQLSSYIRRRMPDKAMDIIQSHGEKLGKIGPILCKIAVLYMEKDRVESAIKCYMTALERDVCLFEAWASLGEITLNLNKLEDAQLFFQKALEIDKNNTEIMLRLCEIKSKIGNIDSVIQYCNILSGQLNLSRKTTIRNIDELKTVLFKIETSLNNKRCSEHINKIIANLTLNQPNHALLDKRTALKKRALIIALIDIPQNITTGDYFYRTFSPGMALSQEKDIYVVSISNIHPQKLEILNSADIVILNNICDPDLLPVISKRKEDGLLTVFELSDDLNAVQPWNAVYEFYQKKENIALIYTLANYCDKLQFSVYELQKLYGILNPANTVFPNQILDLPPEKTSNSSDEFIIGWGGSHGHLEDIAAVSDQLIKWIMSKPRAKLYLMGSKDIWNLFKELPAHKKKYFPTGSLQDYYQFLSELHVGIAPLQNTAFNRCRSDVKFLEYAVSGVVPLLADLEPYRISVIHGETGFLFKNSTGLINTLDLLINNKRLIKNVSVSAKAYVTKQRLQSDHISERMEFYRNGVQSKQSMGKKGPDPETLFEGWSRLQGAVKKDRLLILSNTEFEKFVYSGLALMQNESDKRSANDLFKKASRLEPQNYLPFLYRSITSSDPISQLAKAIKLAPFSIKARILMGEEFARQGKIADAITAFTSALEIFPEYEIPLLRAGNLLEMIGKHDQAKELLRRVSDLQITLPETNCSYG